MLGMATKYLCHQFRADIISHLTLIYPSKRQDLSSHKHLIPNPSTYPPGWCHSFHAIHIARQNNVVSILPTAFYMASLISPDKHSECIPRLSPVDYHRILKGRTLLTDAAINRAWRHVSQTSYSDCNENCCGSTRYDELQSLLLQSGQAVALFMRPEPHAKYTKLLTDEGDAVQLGHLCWDCWDDWRANEKEKYTQVWEALPGFFDLGTWTEIQAWYVVRVVLSASVLPVPQDDTI